MLRNVYVWTCQTIAVIATCAMFVILGLKVMRSTDYANNWPQVSQPDVGPTIPYQARRSIQVFISKDDERYDSRLEYAWYAVIAAAVLFGLVSGELPRTVGPKK